MATYAATKAYVLSLSEALWEENREYGIAVLALRPGVTDANFFEAANSAPPGMRVMQTPEEVVETGLKALAARRGHVVCGWMNFMMTESERVVPRSMVTRVAGKALRKQYKSRG